MRFGSGDLTYSLVEGWPKIPDGWDLVDVSAVAVDSRDNVHCFSRSPHPVVVFDSDGNFLRSWGETIFTRAHGICIGPDDSVYCVDDGDHTVRKCTPEGHVLMTIGIPGQHSETGYIPGNYTSVLHAGPPFYRPTSVALSPEGDIYVTDGYANARVHKFSPEGKLIFSWGEPGSKAGQFRLVHGICVASDGTVYVGDRMNSRVQVFDPQGEFIAQWQDVYQPNDLFLDGSNRAYVAEIGYRSDLPLPGPTPTPEDSYARVTIRDLTGQILACIAPDAPVAMSFDDAGSDALIEESFKRAMAPGGFAAPHGICQDSRGALYVGEVAASRARNKGRDAFGLHVLHKFERLTA